MGDSIGALLRDTREARGLTIEDVERATRIRAKYLIAIEAGEFNALPSAAQARGFLRNYAQHLGLNADQLLTQFDATSKRSPRAAPQRPIASQERTQPVAPRPRPALPIQPVAPAPLAPQPPPTTTGDRAPGVPVASRRGRWLSADVLVGGLIVIALIAFFIWGGSRLAADFFNPTPESTPLELGRPTDTPSPTATAVVVSATATLAPITQPLTSVPVTLNFEQTAWVRVMVDGTDVFSGIVAPGKTQEYTGKNSVEVVTGNGAGVRVVYAGRDEGLMGGFGGVVIRLYTLNGIITPTPSPTPIVTETLTPLPVTDTATLPPSDTPIPSRTPRFSPTPGVPGTELPSPTPTLAPTAKPIPSETLPPSPTKRP
ncbi:MAG: DUF4115 domain-containing protein [Chloroflexi bacterium]|nr:DUF4115 domain-containing protein [Chloroflexota bacterium]